METKPPEPTPVAKPPPPPVRPSAPPVRVPPRRGGGGMFTGLLVLVALLASGYSLWRVEQGRKPASAAQAQAMTALEQQIDSANHASVQLRGDLDALRSRFRDADTVNKGLREEMLGMAERSRHLDDAIANLAEQRLTGRDALALNEAEFLLMMANERYQLFGDGNAALSALQLADSALASSQDPVFASVRATIKSEVDAMSAAPTDATAATLRALGSLADSAGDWPMRTGEPDEAVDPDASRVSRVLSRLVRIRHDDDTLATREPTLARSLLRIDLHAAAAAWLARNASDYQASMQRVRKDVVASFDDTAAPTKAALAEIDRLAALTIAPPQPVLGTALKELRDLRATRALSRHEAQTLDTPSNVQAPEQVAPQPAPTEQPPAVQEPIPQQPTPQQQPPASQEPIPPEPNQQEPTPQEGGNGGVP